MPFTPRSSIVLGCLCLGLRLSADRLTPASDLIVPDGLQVREFAATPLIYSPVAMDVDLKGRLWIVEDLNQTEFRTREAYSRISILEDTDQDGRADKVSQFGPTFDSLVMGIAVFDNRIVVSMAPDLIVYTDVNRNLKFEEGMDTREVLMTGFEGHGHDHALHGVVPGPDGGWFFSHGNTGLDIETRDGLQFHASSYYSFNQNEAIGKRSSDGHLYIGGVGFRMDADGRNAGVIFHNTRNTHDLVVTSFGDVLHGDNDDPAHARAAWAMTHSNFGYASLEDGSRSWEDSAKSWEEKEIAAHRRGEGKLRLNEGHWRKNVPGTVPPGVQWGAGAPTGNAFIEGDELGRRFRGTYLLCETVNQSVFAFRTSLREAQVELEHQQQSLLSVKEGVGSDLLLTDVVVALDGSLYVSDWCSANNRRGRGGKEGAIYWISKAGQKAAAVPALDFDSAPGLLEALKSPAPNVRWLAGEAMRKRKDLTPALLAFLDVEENPYCQARAIWMLAAQKDGLPHVGRKLNGNEESLRVTAFRALMKEFPAMRAELLSAYAGDPSMALRREVALNLRDKTFQEAQDPMLPLLAGYDGTNRWYLEALGQAALGKEEQVYLELVRPKAPQDFSAWDMRDKMMAWRLQTPASLDDLLQVILAHPPSVEDFRLLTAGFSLTETPEKRQRNQERLEALARDPAFAGEDFQVVIREFLDKDVLDQPPLPLTASYVFPESYGNPTTLGSVEAISALPGNRESGQIKSAICLTCHRIGAHGIAFGPNLSNWGQARDLKVIIHNIVNPSDELAHGFEKPVVLRKGDLRMEGIDVGYSHHAGAIRVKTVGGQTHKIGFRRNQVKIEWLQNHSWMPSASKLGLNDQDVRDVAEYLKTL